MRAIEIGRRLAELGQFRDAIQSFELALEKEQDQMEPIEILEAAVFLLENGGNYRAAYDAFLYLYQSGAYQEEIFHLLTGAFYEPNVRDLRRRYERNVKSLQKYPWLFQKDFPAFEDLPLLFFPYDDRTYVPFDTRTGAFLPKASPRRKVITRNFFRDLEKPILADDVFSQYELEYLRDNVRRSEDVGRENHIYLRYSDWEVFCAWLQTLNIPPLLAEEKFVFLFGQDPYPLDFKAKFGIDYSQYPIQPFGIREITKLIWHTQLSAHNGGDFFNEIFDNHPNLLFLPSIFLKSMEDEVETLRETLRAARNLRDLRTELLDHWKDPRLVAELYHMKKRTDKDLMIALYLGSKKYSPSLDTTSRIVPAVFFQPHFSNIVFNLSVSPDGDTTLESAEIDALHRSKLFRDFKYVKTFTPVRRFTSSYGGSMRFAMKVGAYVPDPEGGGAPGEESGGAPGEKGGESEGKEGLPDRDTPTVDFICDLLGQRVRNWSFLVDPEDRLFQDSVLVRLEDGKLNPAATLSRLAAFLDVPYTESMTYCSRFGRHDPTAEIEAAREDYSPGFSLKSVYETFDDYVNTYEKRYIEYLMRDAYQYFGYDFQAYDGVPVDEDTVLGWIDHFDTMEQVLRKAQNVYFDAFYQRTKREDFQDPEKREEIFQQLLSAFKEMDRDAALALMAGVRFVNRNGVPLRMGRLLEPDPALLVKPLYH